MGSLALEKSVLPKVQEDVIQLNEMRFTVIEE